MVENCAFVARQIQRSGSNGSRQPDVCERVFVDTALGRYGKWKTVHRRFSRWCQAGIWEQVFDALSADRDNLYLMIDSTIVRAHQQAASGKEGAKDQALGRSRGGLRAKVHMLVDA
jgi:hypothetical protein